MVLANKRAAASQTKHVDMVPHQHAVTNLGINQWEGCTVQSAYGYSANKRVATRKFRDGDSFAEEQSNLGGSNPGESYTKERYKHCLDVERELQTL